ncbi:MAG: metal-dependent hydrolase [Planctomycetota bacterium]|jgi:inner membrane protein|nr:metal-dependent hydrolase [Planctomycetota bacterium]
MDPLTHALAGQAIADAWFGRRLGSEGARIAALAALAPDLDLLPAFLAAFPPKWTGRHLGLIDPGLTRRFHRAYTHSFFFAALASPLLGYLAWRWSGRRDGWPAWSLLILLALYSHILLDLANPYGVRAWLPFSEERSSWGDRPLFDIPGLAILATVFGLNHGLRRSPPEPAFLRGRPAAWLDRLAPARATAVLGLILLAGRIIAAILWNWP